MEIVLRPFINASRLKLSVFYGTFLLSIVLAALLATYPIKHLAFSPSTTVAATPATKQPTGASGAFIACTPESAPRIKNMHLLDATPGMHQDIQQRYYEIYGKNTGQLRKQLEQCGPVSDDGQRHPATTTFNISWDFDYALSAKDPLVCSLDNISVGLVAKQTLPRWTPTNDSKNLNKTWDQLSANLISHENGHLQLIESTSAAILAKLQSLPVMPCATIGKTALTTANEQLSRLDKANARHDIDTNRKITEGINF